MLRNYFLLMINMNEVIMKKLIGLVLGILFFGFSSAFGFGCGRRCGLFGLGVAEPGLSNVLRLADWRRFFNRFAFGFLQILRLLVGQLDFIEDGVDSLIDLFLFVRSDRPLLFHLFIDDLL